MPTFLPWAATKYNIPKFKEWNVEYYKALAFNQCIHHVLPLVEAPKVAPTALHKPAQVLIHFVKEIKEGLEKDVHLGVLERVPENTHRFIKPV